MNDVTKKMTSAALTVTNSLAATAADIQSGIGSFFSGSHAHTHDAAPVQEAPQEREQKTKEPTDTTAGQVVVGQQIGGKDYYLVQTENPAGKPERLLFEKNGTDYQPGQEMTVKWDEGKPAHAKAEKGAELPWGGEIAGKSQFNGQSQFASNYHDDGQGL
ncbi:hypothetical protein [Duganella callida]|uniref:DUF2782 domain-containing protein n=1 Tax=Duganella callida TaxID=2561932 RepID=A0A4Y9SPR0_9BURK|nr:hypothetical protein [Duganella callida]TFW28465.1 hypothetical protein E4L98_05605 [Duganella callida]